VFASLDWNQDSILSALTWLESQFSHYGGHVLPYKDILEIILVFSLVVWAFWRLAHIQAARPLLKGFVFVVLGYFIARFTGFDMLARLLEFTFLIGILGFVVLFQPELRRLISASTQPSLWMNHGGGKALPSESSELTMDRRHLAHELLETLRILSKRKIGALIVYETDTTNRNAYLEIGTPIQARLSSELLLTIFHPNTPLHDGAVIVQPDGQIVSAGVLLPLSENPKLSWEYGTRHRAAVGLTEVSSNVCLVVSEETGRVSMAQNGQITRLLEREALESAINAMLGDALGPVDVDEKRTPLLGELFSADFFQRFFSTKSSS
jgi:diadenylate cyclase